jgi:hypothetical protein
VLVNGFRFTIPSGWHVLQIDRPMGAFYRTEAENPSGSELLIIDRDPSEALPPAAWGRSVERETSGTPGYQRVSVATAALSGRPALVWKFELGNEPLPARVDVFQHVPSNGFAVLGDAATMPAATKLALAVAGSMSQP